MAVNIIMVAAIDMDAIVLARVDTLGDTLVVVLGITHAVTRVVVHAVTHVVILMDVHEIINCVKSRGFFVAPASQQLPPFRNVTPTTTSDHILGQKLRILHI